MPRLRSKLLLFLTVLAAWAPSVTLAANCGENTKTTISTKAGNIQLMSSKSGAHPTIFYRTDLDVNTDGAARSYHPDDPRGNFRALNNLGNAITRAWGVNGKQVTCDGGDAANRHGDCFTEYMDAYEGAKSNGFDPSVFPRIETKFIIPWKFDPSIGHDVPCLNDEGFFVSQTSLHVNSSLGVCDQDRYVDSLKINAVVYIPQKLISQGVTSDKGDLVVVRDRTTKRVAFALHGDSNPSRIGEGTVALVAELSNVQIASSATKADMYKLKRPDVDFLVFARDDVVRFWKNQGGTTPDRINEFGNRIFEAWGGIERLNACSDEYDRAN